LKPRPGCFAPWNDPASILQEAGSTPQPFCNGTKMFASTRTRSPDPPACSASLYRLSYPGPNVYPNMILCLYLLPWCLIYAAVTVGRNAYLFFTNLSSQPPNTHTCVSNLYPSCTKLYLISRTR
jgi:hypothetical protein